MIFQSIPGIGRIWNRSSSRERARTPSENENRGFTRREKLTRPPAVCPSLHSAPLATLNVVSRFPKSDQVSVRLRRTFTPKRFAVTVSMPDAIPAGSS